MHHQAPFDPAVASMDGQHAAFLRYAVHFSVHNFDAEIIETWHEPIDRVRVEGFQNAASLEDCDLCTGARGEVGKFRSYVSTADEYDPIWKGFEF